MNIPILITLSRILILPFFIIVFYLPFSWTRSLCTLIFFISAMTDLIDGFLARRWQKTTKLGSFLDPIADKLMIIIVLILLTEDFHSWWITLPTLFIIVREVFIISLREWIYKITGNCNFEILSISKIKTLLQMFSLGFILWQKNSIFIWIGVLTLYISVGLTYLSIFQYFYLYKKKFLDIKNDN